MKITAFNSSPWGKEGHTEVMLYHFLLGAHSAGAHIHSIDLADKDIQVCRDCGECFLKTPGKCSTKDDMSVLIHQFLSSDIAIFATPLYMDNVSATMKLFIDRLLPVLEPHVEKDIDGRFLREARHSRYPKIVALSSCSLPGQSHFDVIDLFFERLSHTLHTEVVGSIYRDAAGVLLLSKEDLRFRDIVNAYEQMLHYAGSELVKKGHLTEPTERKLLAPMFDPQEYVRYINHTWDQLIARHASLK